MSTAISAVSDMHFDRTWYQFRAHLHQDHLGAASLKGDGTRSYQRPRHGRASVLLPGFGRHPSPGAIMTCNDHQCRSAIPYVYDTFTCISLLLAILLDRVRNYLVKFDVDELRIVIAAREAALRIHLWYLDHRLWADVDPAQPDVPGEPASLACLSSADDS